MHSILNTAVALGLSAVLLNAAAAPTTYTVEPTHTSVTAETRHFGTSTTRTHLQGKSGSITIDPAAGTGFAVIAIDVTSLITGVPKLDADLKTEKFFDTASYPDATFTGRKFTFDGDKVTQITGDLTMHGVTAPVTLTATNYNCYLNPNFRRGACGGDFEATIQRSTWGMNYGIPFVSDETKLKLQIEALKD